MSDYDRWAADYELWAAEMTEDVAWYVELGRQADGPVVELAVGTGRVAIPVAAALGRPVLGIDRSPAMLAVAHERARDAGVELPADNRIDLVRGRGAEEEGRVSLWWATRSEWEGLLEVAGLETDALYGWFDGRPFTEESQEFVWVARKPG